MSHRALPVLLVCLLLAVGGAALLHERIAALLVGGVETGETEEALHVWPDGFWHRMAPVGQRTAVEEADPAERARLLSLPYLGGRAPAGAEDRYGVVRYDPEAALHGLNLYTSGHGPEAVLMDMEGRRVHRWRLPFEEAFPEMTPNRDTSFFRRAHLFPDGRLLVLYQTGGLALLDRRSSLLARCSGSFYNDLWVGDDGRVWTLGKEVAGEDAAGERLDDFVVLLDLGGPGAECRELRRISLTRTFESSPFASLLEHRAPAGDVLHSNTVQELDGSLVHLSPLFAAGNLLVSLREIDVVAILDPEELTVVWARRGPWRAQYEPTLLADGRILLFDNLGRDGGSRLLEIDPTTGELGWTWSGDPPGSLDSSVAGTAARLANGNTLVTESVPGRAFELDPRGRIVWEFLTPHRTGLEDSLVAILFEVVRVPAGLLEGPWT